MKYWRINKDVDKIDRAVTVMMDIMISIDIHRSFYEMGEIELFPDFLKVYLEEREFGDDRDEILEIS